MKTLLSATPMAWTGQPIFYQSPARKQFWFLAVLLCFLAAGLAAQQPVSVQPVLPPPYSPYLEDYLDKAVITLTNHSTAAQQIKLVGNIESDDGIFVKTADDWQPAMPITLLPHQVKTLFVNSRAENFLDPQNVETNVNETQQADIARTGILPEGNYTFCVRAVDFVSGADLSAQAPQGCIPIVISYPEPPALISPICGTDVTLALPNFAWTPPIGNLSGAAVRYDFYLLKLLAGQDPNDAMQLAINYNAGNPLKISDLQTAFYNYKPFDPPLANNAEYAFAVVAKDLNNKVVFQNNGQSEVCTFIWKKPGKVLDNDPPGLVNTPGNSNNPPEDGSGDPENVLPQASSCAADCAFDLSDPGTVWQSPSVAKDTVLKIGDFNMTVFSVDAVPKFPGTLSGTGLIPVPFLNFDQARLRVRFDSIVLNTDKRVVAGYANAMVNPQGASFIPNYNDTGWDGFSAPPGADLLGFADWISGQVDSAYDHLLTAYETFGWEVPLGYGSGGHSLAITRVRFKPTFAQFDAIGVVNLPDFTGVTTPLALGVGSLCFSSSDLCQEGKLFLAQPFGIDLMSQPGKELTLLQSTPDLNDLEGTYMTFDTSGIGVFHLEADYKMPLDVMTRADGQPGPVIAHFEATMDSLSDWLFIGLIDDFYAAGSKDFRFHADTVWVDLSDATNPNAPNMDAAFIPLYSDPTWTGLFCRTIETQFKNPLNDDPLNPTTFGAYNLFIDSSGVSVHVAAHNLIDLTEGEVESFNFTLDSLNVVIQHNSFVHANMGGSMLFNIAGRDWNNGVIDVTARTKQNMLVYHCLLTHLDPDPGDGVDDKKLQYQFVMHPKGDVEVPIWYFNLNLDSTSHILVTNNNQQNKLFAECMLNGDFGINFNIPAVGYTDFAGIHFENLGLKSENPYFDTDAFSISLASPQHSLSDFPLNINDISFVPSQNGLFGVQFDIALKLSEMNAMLPDASSKFTIYGTLFDAGNKVNPSFHHAELNQICLDANLSVVHIKGCVTLFNDDATYGNGFKGNLEVNLPSMANVAATLQIGRVNSFDYWYFDALLMLPNSGIPIFSGLELFGFGGGAYYHMARQQDTLVYAYDASSKVEVDTTASPEIGQSNSGATYIPDQSVDLGIKALIYFGSQGQRDVFNGDVGLEITIVNGGLGQIRLDGNARFVSDEDMKKGTITGFLHALYDHPQKVFALNAGANLDAEIVKASAVLAVYIDGKMSPVGFHVKFGRPLPGEFANITFLDVYTIETYFEFGNFDIDPMPGPPAFIANMPGVQNFMANSSQRFMPGPEPGKFAILHGGRTTVSFSGSFLAFYAAFDAGFGYDMQLAEVTQGCGGQSASQTGFDGWYATGQAYIGFKGEVGLEVDLDFVSGRFSILELGMAALVQGGFCNPAWVAGTFTGDYSLLDGMVTGHFEYPFEIGDKCVIPDPDPLEKIKLVTDIFPEDKAKNLDVTSMPSAATILKMDPMQKIHMTQKLGNGSIKHHLFWFGPSLVNAELTLNGNQESLENPVISDSRYGLSWLPTSTLAKDTEYQLKITAQIMACDNVVYDAASKSASCTGNWAIAKYNGADWKEEHIVKFRTNEGLDSIPESLVEYTMPYQRSRAFLWQNEGGKPRIKMSQGFNPASYKLGPSGATVTFKSQFIPLNSNANTVTKPIAVAKGDTAIVMDWPGVLQPSTYYSVRFLASWEVPQNANGNGQGNAVYDPNNPNSGGAFTSKEVNKEYWASNYKFATIYKTKLNTDKLIIPKNTVKLYEIRFKTSQHADLLSKLEPMVAGEAMYTIGQGNQQYTDVKVSGKDLDSPEDIAAAINKKLGLPASNVPIVRFMPYVRMRGEERFDHCDVYGYSKDMDNGTVFTRKPFLKYTGNSTLRNHHAEWIEKLQKTLLDKHLAARDLANLLEKFNSYFEAPTDGPIGWDDGLTGTGTGNFAGLGGENFIFYQPGGGFGSFGNDGMEIGGNGQIGGIGIAGNGQVGNGSGVVNNGMPLYDGKKWVLKYITEPSGRWQPPVVGDPFEWIGDWVDIVDWSPNPVIETYEEYLEHLGLAFDLTETHWGPSNPVINTGNPVIQTPGGILTFPVRGGAFNPLGGPRRVGGK